MNSVFLTDYGFSASIPSKLIYSFGVIKLYTDFSEADFHEGLSSLFPIEGFSRITVNKDGIITPTHLVELKFISSRLPQHITVFNMIFEVSRVSVLQFIAIVASVLVIPKNFVEAIPGAVIVEASNTPLSIEPPYLQLTPSCLFCHLPRMATNRSCHEWSIQKDIKKIMGIENISYQEAVIFKKN